MTTQGADGRTRVVGYAALIEALLHKSPRTSRLEYRDAAQDTEAR